MTLTEETIVAMCDPEVGGGEPATATEVALALLGAELLRAGDIAFLHHVSTVLQSLCSTGVLARDGSISYGLYRWAPKPFYGRGRECGGHG